MKGLAIFSFFSGVCGVVGVGDSGGGRDDSRKGGNDDDDDDGGLMIASPCLIVERDTVFVWAHSK